MTETPTFETIDFLEENSEKEVALSHLRRVIIEKTQAVFKRIQGEFGNLATRRDFFSLLSEIWPENNGRRVKPEYYINFEYAGKLKKIAVIFGDSSSADKPIFESDGISKRVFIRLDSINSHWEKRPVTPEGVNVFLENVYHEVEHVFYPGHDSLDDSDLAELIGYYTNPGEIRAYARQFAHTYSLHYPGEIFDLKKMQALALESGDGRAINYFNSFADPEKQAKYAEFGDIKKTHETIVSLTERFVDHGLTGKYRGALKSTLAGSIGS